MGDGGVIILILAVIMIVSHLIKSIREAADIAKLKQQQEEAEAAEEFVVIKEQKPKPNRPPKSSKQRPPTHQPLGHSLGEPYGVVSLPQPKRQQALSRKLGTQGEGQRFEVAPGTLDTTQIVAPTIDPTVRPDLGSITGIFEEGAQVGRKTVESVSLDIGNLLSKPEGIVQAVILAEILNKPAWQESAVAK